jgi:fatty-acyl-CoA synthase
MQTQLLLEMASETLGDQIAIGGAEGGLSYRKLAAHARAAAVWLSNRPGDKLVFVGLNGEAFPVALFAAGYAGRPFSPLNYRLSDSDLQNLLARTAPSLAIVDDDMLDRVGPVEGVALVSRSDFEQAYRDPARQSVEIPETEQDVAVLLFTSGTTGEPKVAVLRHRHLTSYVLSTVDFAGAGEDEAALVSVPPYHIAGISAVLTGIFGGRRIGYLASFTPDGWVEAARSERVSHAMVVPTMLGRILDVLQDQGGGLPGLRALSYGGGRMPLPVIERAMELLPQVDFVNAYGLTETSSTVAVLDPEDHRAAMQSDDPLVRRRLGSVGRPLPSLELEIRDPEGRALPHGHSGEVYIRGDQVAGEYLHRKVIQDDGWFATNDAGFLDNEGYLFVEGRLDDVIVRGGENISPGEIEDVLRTHNSVIDVAVFGLPDDQWGEQVAAVLVTRNPAPDVLELSEWVRARLRSTKTPQIWDFRVELPYNETGKLLRRVLRQELISKYRSP